MSVINRLPLINEILSSLSAEQLSSLRDCINGQGDAPIFRSLKPVASNHLTTADKGVKPIQIEPKVLLGGMNVLEGYLIYTDEICYVICVSGDKNQALGLLHINPTTCEAEFVNGALTILELRSELDDVLNAGGGSGGGSGGNEIGFAEINMPLNSTLGDFLDAIGYTGETIKIPVIIKYQVEEVGMTFNRQTDYGFLEVGSRGPSSFYTKFYVVTPNPSVCIYSIDYENDRTKSFADNFFSNRNEKYLVPIPTGLTQNKTYVLKCNWQGQMSWVEEATE